VKRGQPIARVGKSGAVAEPQLHFEVRRGSKALDPADYLPAAPTTTVSG
jgi:murein DD-endopeptidase MepM/ murein hydrolase activator NlpD